jgi:hypothetical protein
VEIQKQKEGSSTKTLPVLEHDIIVKLAPSLAPRKLSSAPPKTTIDAISFSLKAALGTFF